MAEGTIRLNYKAWFMFLLVGVECRVGGGVGGQTFVVPLFFLFFSSGEGGGGEG